MKIYRLTEPDPFITLAEMKEHLNVDDSDHDTTITALTNAAIQYLDGDKGIIGRALAPATYRMELNGFPTGPLCIPLPPTISVNAIEYLDENGDLQTFATSEYRVTGLGSNDGATIVLDQVAGVVWPPVQTGRDPDTVRVTFRAGFETQDSPSEAAVPEPIVTAIKLMVSDWYDHRSSSVIGTSAQEVPFSAMCLLAPWRMYLPDTR